jgi:Na+-transporting NADH:ubiquinone oxidoreductase subunit NqrC
MNTIQLTADDMTFGLFNAVVFAVTSVVVLFPIVGRGLPVYAYGFLAVTTAIVGFGTGVVIATGAVLAVE